MLLPRLIRRTGWTIKRYAEAVENTLHKEKRKGFDGDREGRNRAAASRFWSARIGAGKVFYLGTKTP
jgi:hypothetical protein